MHEGMVHMTALDIQVSLRNQIAILSGFFSSMATCGNRLTLVMVKTLQEIFLWTSLHKFVKIYKIW